MSKIDLRVDFCSHEAAKYAVEKWHYTATMPQGRNNYWGVWENGKYIGCVIYGFSISPQLGKEFDLTQHEVTELKRVALNTHQSFVSQVVAMTLRQLKTKNADLRLVVSFADTMQDHHGGIYQAGNWVYIGTSSDRQQRLIDGRWRNDVHAERAGKKWTDVRKIPGKHKYLYPLDRAMRRQIEPLAKPYPKRADVGEIESRVGTTD